MDARTLAQPHQTLTKYAAIVPVLPKRPVAFHWYTPYGSENDTEAGPLWEAINTAHGGIAIDHDFAAKNQWQKSMPVPGDETKGLYLLESYHQLHCLVGFLPGMADSKLEH